MSKKEDLQRLEESIPVLFGVVARRLLTKEDEPYVVTESSIESNGTKAKRTMRVLSEAGYLCYRRPAPGVRSYSTYYQVDREKFKAESPSYAKPVDFSSSKLFEDIEGCLTNQRYSYRSYPDDVTLDTSGQRKIGGARYYGPAYNNGLNTGEALTVWWNLNDYVFNNGLDWDACSEPESVLLRAVHKEYVREAARAIVDVYVKHNMHILLPADMGLTRQGSDDEAITVGVKNFMHHEVFLDDTHFKSIENTYEEQLEYAQNMLRAYQTVHKLRQEAGGLEPYVAHLRKAAIKRIIEEAPLHISTKDEEVSLYSNFTFHVGDLSRYVLQHIEAFDYDYLYTNTKNDYLLDDQSASESEGLDDWDADLMIKLWDEGETDPEEEDA